MPSDDLVTRRQADLHWGISRSTLLRAEKAGLTAHREERGEVRYPRHEVEALAAKMRRSSPALPGAADAKTFVSIFGRLEKGESLADIVCQEQQHPDLVESVAARWQRMKGVTIALTPSDVGELLAAIGVHPVPGIATVAGLLEVIRSHRRTGARPAGKAGEGAPPGSTSGAEGSPIVVADELPDLTEQQRTVVMADDSFKASVGEALEDLERGELNRAQAIDAIQRAGQRVLKVARAVKKGARRRSGGN